METNKMRAYDAVTHNIQIPLKYNVHTDYFYLGRIN